MNPSRTTRRASTLRTGWVALLVAVLAACSSTSRPVPAALPADAGQPAIRQVWTTRLPAAPLPPQADAEAGSDTAMLAAVDGTVVALNAASGAEVWRAKLDAPLLAGVGSDGSLAAVVTRDNELVVLQRGQVLWRQRMAARVYTAPLVAGGRVFVQSADRTLSAWDGPSGRRLWLRTRTAEQLVLQKPGVLLAVGNLLVAGAGGRLVGMDPADGGVRWEVPIAAPRGTNDVERLVDLAGPAARRGDAVCVRAYQAAVGCVDTARGTLRWTRPAMSAEGLSGDGAQIDGTETNGELVAWRRDDGERLWASSRLKNRVLTAPLAVGDVLLIGENTGTLHIVSRTDGALLGRITPDGSPIDVAPVRIGRTVIVTTRQGGVFGYRLD